MASPLPRTPLGMKRISHFWVENCAVRCAKAGRPHVRFGSRADICGAPSYVRFTPKIGHVRCNGGCPLWAKSGHSTQPGTCKDSLGIQRVSQPNYSGASALRNGMLEICISPENG